MRLRAFAFLALLFALVACARSPALVPSASRATATTPRDEKAAHGVAPLRAGTSGDYPPLSLWKDERVEGFAPALVTAFAAAQGTEVRWTRFGWPRLADDLKADRFELAADGITVRPERSVAGRFSVPIARGGAVLLVRRSLSVGSAAVASMTESLARVKALDRPGFVVLVNKGGHLEHVARALLHAAEIRALADNDGVRSAFARGEGDAAMTNTFEAPRWEASVQAAASGSADAGGSRIDEVGPLTDDVTAIWLPADRAELADRLDAWLLDEEESGRLGALRARWLGPGAGPRAASPVSAILAATSERLALMPFVAAAKQRTGKAVEDAAQEERVLAASAKAVDHAAALRGKSAPRRELIDAFFRAQIEAAKAVQASAALPPTSATFSLEDDLRPAIARVSARLASLVVRIPVGLDRAAVLAEARADLASTGLPPEAIERIASAISELSSPAR